MPHTITARRLAAATAVALLAACGGDMKTPPPKYANDADTGAASPATQQTLSPNPGMGDSTVGMSRGTGVGNMAGDTAGAFGKAAGQHGAVPGQPTSGPAGSGMQNATGAPQSKGATTAKPVPATPH